MRGAYLGPSYTNDESRLALVPFNARCEQLPDDELLPRVAALLAAGHIVGWFSGRMEFGPRALGARSIPGDPRNPGMQSTMNLRIKFRESFRPFAPAIPVERLADYFDIDCDTPYMLLVAQVQERLRTPMSTEKQQLFGIEKLRVVRSSIPAVTHVDYSARIQSVHHETNPRFHALLSEFERQTACPVLVNTSFNVRGEPVVCSPEDAYACFMSTAMDFLVIENLLFDRTLQPPRSLRGFHPLARRVGDRVAAIQSFVVLTIVYFVVIVPLGLLLQLSQRLRRGRRSVATYRVPAVARPKSSFEKPF
ncbi:MAG: hypothetical protein JWO97_395 [Acidobacteria bacterium]|nr:hypothetical protein [Acidobacteriota bacterium]